MKRKLSIALACLLSLSVLATSCSKPASSSSSQAESSSSSEASSEESSSSEAEAEGEQVTITYGGWEDHVMALELAEKFTQRNPNIKVEVFNDGTWLGNENMAKLAATNSMPDIINLQDVVVPTQNNWVIDMKPYYDKDTTAKNLPENFIKYGTVNDKLVMLPGAVYLFGIMVNLDLLSANGIDAPSYQWTVDEFVNAVKKTNKPGSTVGINDATVLMKHFSPQRNPQLGWGSFNEETKKYDLNADWQKSVELSKQLLDAKVSVFERLDANGLPWEFEDGSAEKKEVEEKRANFLKDLFGEKEAGDGWVKGKAGLWFDFTWAMNFDKTNANYGGFEWDFYPIPVYDTADVPRTPFVVDSIGITSVCKNPEAAYEFVKYLSYSTEGIEDRMALVEGYDREALMAKYPDLSENKFEHAFTYSQMPVTTDMDVIKRWADFNEVKPGVTFALENLGRGYADGYKVTPGFDDAYHKTIEKAVKEQVFTGKKTIADIVPELEKKANKITEDAYALLAK